MIYFLRSILIYTIDPTDHLQILDVVVGDGVRFREVGHWIQVLTNEVLPEELQEVEL